MAIYVDDAAVMLKGKPRFHLTADSWDELHSFTSSIGVARCWFHAHKKHPHYDVTAIERDTALAAGAHAVDSRTIVRIARKLVGK